MRSGGIEQARPYRARGFRIIAYGVDVLLLQGALKSGIAALREADVRS